MTVERTEVKVDTSALDDLLQKLNAGLVARVGILEDKGSEIHEGSDMSNASIGVVHEFGSEKNNIPPRSFLRMPIEAKQKELMNVAKTKTFQTALQAGDMKTVFTLVGMAAENLIKQAFTSRGFGQWPDLKPATIKRKGSSAPLIDTGQLRRSVSSDVVKESDIG